MIIIIIILKSVEFLISKSNVRRNTKKIYQKLKENHH
jgi:hypothetical protein